MIWFAVAVGGALGSMARHASTCVAHLVERAVPDATAAVNVAGQVALGLALVWAGYRVGAALT
jgi:fluoride ion exporter CrcB/FEX